MAKAKARGKSPSLRALRKRYKGQALKLQKIYKTEYETYIRAYRHEVAIGKKRGVISKSIDARKAMPTHNLTRALMRGANVIDDRARAQVIKSPKMRKQLKDEGYEIIGDKVIVAKNNRINKRGELVEKVSGKKIVNTVIKLGSDVEAQVRAIMAGMAKDEYVGIPLPASNFSQLFGRGTEDFFAAVVNKYLEGLDYDGNQVRSKLKYVYVRKLANEEEAKTWENNKRIVAEAREEKKKEIKKANRKQKRRKKAALRKLRK